jgi:hypothetical protein
MICRAIYSHKLKEEAKSFHADLGGQQELSFGDRPNFKNTISKTCEQAPRMAIGRQLSP